MGILDELIGGGKRQNEYKDFGGSNEKGYPYEGYSGSSRSEAVGEVVQRRAALPVR